MRVIRKDNISTYDTNFGVWNQYVLVYDGEFRFDYINAESVGSFQMEQSRLRVKDLPVYIGSNTNPEQDEFAEGYITIVRIYNRALSASEVSNLYADASQNDCDNGMVAWYRFMRDNITSDACDYQGATYAESEDPYNDGGNDSVVFLIGFFSIFGCVIITFVFLLSIPYFLIYHEHPQNSSP